MEIGFIRPTKRTSAARQKEDLGAAGITLIEEEWEIVWQHIRPGDFLVVTSLHLLAPDEREYLKRLRDIEAHGGQVRDLATGRVHAPSTLAAHPAVKQAWQDEKLCRDREEMRKRGAKGGKPPTIRKGSKAHKLVMAYLDMGKTRAETIADLRTIHKVEVSERTISRLWAARK